MGQPAQSASQLPPQQQTTGDPTPGVWEARASYVFAGKNCIAICDTDNADPARYTANAFVMAAAKDLLKACEDCMENRGDWAAVMGDAIRKARGQS